MSLMNTTRILFLNVKLCHCIISSIQGCHIGEVPLYIHVHVHCNGAARDLEVGGEGVWESHVAREGTEDEVPHLDAVGRDDVTE